MSDPDPRVFFAAERTLLAWVRTGIAAIGLGFLVARFGYFLLVIQNKMPGSQHTSSTIGVGLVIIGSAMIALSAWQHQRFLTTLPTNTLPPRYSPRLSILFATLLAVAGIALATYLATTTASIKEDSADGRPDSMRAQQ